MRTRSCPAWTRTCAAARPAARTTRACGRFSWPLMARARTGARKFCAAADAQGAHPSPRRCSEMTSPLPALLRPVPFPSTARLTADPVAQAFLLMRIVFTVAPILFGLDKFAGVLTDDWTRYLSTQFNDIIPGSAQDAMYAVGVVEVVAGLTVLVAPRFGGLLVAAWLGGIILNLLLVGGYGD